MKRRTFLGAGVALVTAAAGARYAPLVAGSSFEGLVADALGVDQEVATALLAGARERLGDLDYDRRAAQFAIAVRSPADGLVPEGLRRRAVASFVDALMGGGAPTALALSLNRVPAGGCAGLVQET